MVFAIGNMEFEAFELQSCSGRKTCTVSGFTLIIADFHLTGASEIVANGEIE